LAQRRRKSRLRSRCGVREDNRCRSPNQTHYNTLRTFSEVIGADAFRSCSPKATQASDSELFHGRTALLDEIRNTFSAGSQSERYFLTDRRVGKTSLLNFLPDHLPDTCSGNSESGQSAIKGRFSSATALEKFSKAMPKHRSRSSSTY